MKINKLGRGDKFISSNGIELEVFQAGTVFVQVRKPGDSADKVFTYPGDYDPEEKINTDNIEKLTNKALGGIGKVVVSEKENPIKEKTIKVKKDNPELESFLNELKKGGTSKDLTKKFEGTYFGVHLYTGFEILRKKGIKIEKVNGVWKAEGNLKDENIKDKVAEHPAMKKALKKINKVRRKR